MVQWPYQGRRGLEAVASRAPCRRRV